MTPADRSSTSASRVDALDGIRGFALLGMMAWHAQIGWVKGGFARMTIFFVLAGFLAARSLFRSDGASEFQRFASFWRRRVLRLLPITVVGVAVAVGVTAAVGSPAATEAVVGDSVSVLTWWSNWRFVLEERAYGDMFAAPSAFHHFWSLSLEEQCLVVLPVILWVIAVITRDRGRQVGRPGRRTIAGVLALAVVASGLPLVVEMSPDTAYYGTHVRIGEFLVGVALAIWWGRQDITTWSTRRGVLWSGAGTIGFVALVAIMLTIDREAAWVYRGGMGLIAVPVAALIVAVMLGARPLVNVLAIWPLAALGRAAFSIYALHWPIFQLVEHQLVGRTRNEVILVEFAIALAVGALVHVLIERPLLPSSTSRLSIAWRTPTVGIIGGAMGVSACIVAALIVPTRERSIDFEELAVANEAATGFTLDDALAVLDDGVTARVEIPVFRDESRRGVALFGGSTALTMAMGADAWDAQSGWAQAVPGYAPLGCGLVDGVDRAPSSDPGNLIPSGKAPENCGGRTLRWAATAVAYDINVPIIVASTSELTAHQLAAGGAWVSAGDPEFDDAVRAEIIESVEQFRELGIDTVYATNHVSPLRSFDTETYALRQVRIEAYEVVIRQLEAEGYLRVIDVWSYTARLDDAEYLRMFEDGIHPNLEGAQRLWVDVLGPAISGRR